MAIIKFNAGKVKIDEETKLCTPLATRGEIIVQLSAEGEEFYDFKWVPTENTAGEGNQSETFLVIPGDVTWKHVKSCKDGRVFKLTFLSSGAKSLFWMQDDNGNEDDPSELTTKDKEISEKITKLFDEEE
ncbi:26S proteasome regulatory subunit [Komagataella phaffii CBS 7435]|uniref:Pru domain-containing protein n=2 Tax=Komagataella phaffii TaxID=460519 RepID=C4R160_KOMPG|nr:Hypothetical protein PAS_chr2-1_0597 [Komagataella phaffii GS115]AOA61999.1 GQ67_00653T0 [Komagataella phaffii]KAI0461923.1 hypothetical protein LJB42_004527 [Komagataella kurtzmanii]CAH2448240.1 26S proteasome regulatory subunit [Komagataella phaffii CBS 7435]AOA68111.1 GQ68_00735T0 [Komagataella phaffii GS115]CAY69234.1 Hypothetical protein PAS_chr2-1_0597 [Komagataella phaffii GS115]